MSLRHQRGFTLAELLIALAILGVIATFTIPKVLQSQQNSKYNAMAKEVAASLSDALQRYQYTNTLTATTSTNNLTPYLNYVRIVTTGSVDDVPTFGTYDCSTPSTLCIQLHNGGVLVHDYTPSSFGGTATTNAIYFSFDPDGTASSYKSVNFYLYTTGMVRTEGMALPNTKRTNSQGVQVINPNPALDPSWFSWN